MTYGPNTLGQKGLSGFRVSASAAVMKARPIGINVNWTAVTAVGGVNEVVTITINATGGTFTITFGGQTTAALAWNATADVVEAALEGLSSIGNANVQVSLASLVYTIEFVEDLRHTNVGAVTTNAGSLTGGAGTAAVAVSTSGAADVDETLVDGVTAKLGEKVIRAGTILYKNGSQYEPATDLTSLVRGECYVADRHFFQTFETNMIGDVFDDGTAYIARLRVGGTGQPTLANFKTAFPDVTLLAE